MNRTKSITFEPRAQECPGDYTDAIPLDLLKREQARISHELQQAEQAMVASQTASLDLQATLDEALALASNCQKVYRRANPQSASPVQSSVLREELFINEDGVTSAADLAEPFAELQAHDLSRRAARESRSAENPKGE